MPRIARSAALVSLAVLWLLPLAASADGHASGTPASGTPDWEALADVEEIEVITEDEDGEARETTIWLAVVDGQGFIRTGGSSWGKNVQRNPDVVLRIEGTEYPLRAEFIEDEGLRERVTDTFRAKYGWSDVLISPIRGSDPSIMHMLAR